jgi:hypothetical protein
MDSYKNIILYYYYYEKIFPANISKSLQELITHKPYILYSFGPIQKIPIFWVTSMAADKIFLFFITHVAPCRLAHKFFFLFSYGVPYFHDVELKLWRSSYGQNSCFVLWCMYLLTTFFMWLLFCILSVGTLA